MMCLRAKTVFVSLAFFLSGATLASNAQGRGEQYFPEKTFSPYKEVSAKHQRFRAHELKKIGVKSLYELRGRLREKVIYRLIIGHGYEAGGDVYRIELNAQGGHVIVRYGEISDEKVKSEMKRYRLSKKESKILGGYMKDFGFFETNDFGKYRCDGVIYSSSYVNHAKSILSGYVTGGSGLEWIFEGVKGDQYCIIQLMTSDRVDSEEFESMIQNIATFFNSKNIVNRIDDHLPRGVIHK